jgi:molybdopterin-guanine dinucleotide biosynthesis protein MobB
MNENITAAILSGGKSSRMGKNKSFALLNGIPIIEYVIKCLEQIFPKIVISSNNENLYKNNYKYPVIKDIYQNKDAIGGIYSVLKNIDTQYAFITACDMPFIEENAVKLLIENIKDFDLIIPKIKCKYQPLFAIYSKNCIKPIEKLILDNKLKISFLVPEVKSNILDVSLFKKECNVNKNFFNINSEKDYEKALHSNFSETSMVGIVAMNSNSGKTTLIRKLIPFFKNEGYKIGIIKNVFHKLEIDKQGKDSYIFFETGADSVVINSNSEIVIRKRKYNQLPLKYIRDYFIQDMDIIIVEGHKSGNFPKIELIKEGQQKFLFEEDDNIVAVVSNKKINSDLPNFRHNEYYKLFCFIKENYL